MAVNEVKTTKTLNIQILDSTGAVMKLLKLDNPKNGVTRAEIEAACAPMFAGYINTTYSKKFYTPLFTKSTDGTINGSEGVALGTSKIVQTTTTTETIE